MEKQDILSPSIKRDTARSNRVVLEKTFKYIMSGTRGLKFYTVFLFSFSYVRSAFLLKFASQNSEYCMVKREGSSLFKIRGHFHQPLTEESERYRNICWCYVTVHSCPGPLCTDSPKIHQKLSEAQINQAHQSAQMSDTSLSSPAFSNRAPAEQHVNVLKCPHLKYLQQFQFYDLKMLLNLSISF